MTSPRDNKELIRGIGSALLAVFLAAATILPSERTLYALASAGTGNNDEARVMETVSSDTDIRLYVRGVSPSEDLTYQIGSTQVSEVKSAQITDDTNPMRTIILLDNSLSIPTDQRDKITQVMDGIVDGHADKEEFRIATYSGDASYLSDEYSDDYTALRSMINSIQYEKQSTYLTDVLYAEIQNLNKENYQGYTRFLLISDGVDENKLGVSRDELEQQLRDTPYPVYAYGVTTTADGNKEALQNLFAFSRMTSAEYMVLNESEPSALSAMMSKDNSLTVVRATIPEECKDGSMSNSQLVIGGVTLSAQVQLPFGKTEGNATAADTQPAAQEVDAAATEADTQNTQAASDTESTAAEADTSSSTEGEGAQQSEGIPRDRILLVVIIAGVIAVAAVVLIVILIVRGRKKNIPVPAEDDSGSSETELGGETEMIDEKNDDDIGVQQIFKGGNEKQRYKISLTDKSNAARTFSCEISSSITIGRKNGSNDIVLDYERSVSGKHCMIRNVNGRFFVSDLGSANKTLLNGRPVYSETEIVSGDVLKLGRAELSVTIKKL